MSKRRPRRKYIYKMVGHEWVDEGNHTGMENPGWHLYVCWICDTSIEFHTEPDHDFSVKETIEKFVENQLHFPQNCDEALVMKVMIR